MNRISNCYNWNPTVGKLYQVFHKLGFEFNNKPVVPPYNLYGSQTEENHISYHDVFVYLGGTGGRQTVPGYYIAFKVLYKYKVGWLIYPEFYWDEYGPIVAPIRI